VFGIRDAAGNMVADLASMGANPRRKDARRVFMTGAPGRPGTNFYTLKGAPNNFYNAACALAFRRAIFGHQNNSRAAANDCTTGWAEGTPGNDFMVNRTPQQATVRVPHSKK
jgi:hypothetical protein